jgi:hypothetical protein
VPGARPVGARGQLAGLLGAGAAGERVDERVRPPAGDGSIRAEQSGARPVEVLYVGDVLVLVESAVRDGYIVPRLDERPHGDWAHEAGASDERDTHAATSGLASPALLA